MGRRDLGRRGIRFLDRAVTRVARNPAAALSGRRRRVPRRGPFRIDLDAKSEPHDLGPLGGIGGDQHEAGLGIAELPDVERGQLADALRLPVKDAQDERLASVSAGRLDGGGCSRRLRQSRGEDQHQAGQSRSHRL